MPDLPDSEYPVEIAKTAVHPLLPAICLLLHGLVVQQQEPAYCATPTALLKALNLTLQTPNYGAQVRALFETCQWKCKNMEVSKDDPWPRSALELGKLLRLHEKELRERFYVHFAAWRTYRYGRLVCVYHASVECPHCHRGSDLCCFCEYRKHPWKKTRRKRRKRRENILGSENEA